MYTAKVFFHATGVREASSGATKKAWLDMKCAHRADIKSAALNGRGRGRFLGRYSLTLTPQYCSAKQLLQRNTMFRREGRHCLLNAFTVRGCLLWFCEFAGVVVASDRSVIKGGRVEFSTVLKHFFLSPQPRIC